MKKCWNYVECYDAFSSFYHIKNIFKKYAQLYTWDSLRECRLKEGLIKAAEGRLSFSSFFIFYSKYEHASPGILEGDAAFLMRKHNQCSKLKYNDA